MITPLLNRLLQENPILVKRLIPFKNATIALNFGKSMCWQITDEGLLLAALNKSADARISINLLSLPLWWLNRPAFQRSVCIEGDSKLAMVFAEVLVNLRWDIEAELSTKIGDVAAYRVVNMGKSFFSWSRWQIMGLLEALSEYYQFETAVIVERRQLEQFYQEVDILRADTDRLEKRLILFIRQVGS